MKTHVQNGGRENYLNESGVDIAVDEVVGPLGTSARFGIAIADIADTEAGAICTAGVHKLPATAADAWDHGDTLYWDPTTEKLTDVAGAGPLDSIGTAVGPKAASATTAEFLLNNTTLPPYGGL